MVKKESLESKEQLHCWYIYESITFGLVTLDVMFNISAPVVSYHNTTIKA